jgi:predicted RNA-binding Zn-ribbon protein involved in translation (DUF1610 family)
MTRRAHDARFACPFCRAASVLIIGRGGKFVHYRCPACAEVWTGMKFPEPTANWAADRTHDPKRLRRH